MSELDRINDKKVSFRKGETLTFLLLPRVIPFRSEEASFGLSTSIQHKIGVTNMTVSPRIHRVHSLMSDLTPRSNAGFFILIVDLVFLFSTRFFLKLSCAAMGRLVTVDEVDPSILRLRAALLKALYGVALERKVN